MVEINDLGCHTTESSNIKYHIMKHVTVRWWRVGRTV